MPTILIAKRTLLELLELEPGETSNDGEWKVVAEGEEYRTRWAQCYGRVIQQIGSTNRYYKTIFEKGLTEMQDLHPYEYDPTIIEVTEVVPKEVVSLIYVRADG